ncbi:finTRIM family, member 86 [Tachysurus fulvidraco]|uniref:finTRIM family, member 86 n=1 Tax=Tachysurus fulvidraco TaxID=1234273 RepID=UPI001FEE302F|nr:finTRIM family, member 86 [Tachysurus fulvidraco]
MHCELRSDCKTSQSAFSNSSQPTSFKTNHAHYIHGNRPVIPVIKSTHTRFKIKVLYFGKLGCFMIYRDPWPSFPAMATFSCTSDDFSCPVCLEILCDPATIPCGHTYCLQCIQKHWDKASKGQYSCPQCRQVFNPRPSLGRNNMLMEAMKKLQVGEQDKSLAVCSSLNPCAVVSVNPPLQPAAERSAETTGPDQKTTVQGGLYPQLPSTSPKLCPLHKQVLEFYCRDDKEIVCDECSLIEHKGHRVVNPDEEMEQELSKKKAKILGSIQERERIIQTLPQIFQAKKTAIQGLQTENLEVFGEVMKNVELMSSQVNELLQGYEASWYHRTENHGYKLREEINQLYKQDVELNRLSKSQDSIQFLKTLDTTECVDVVGNAQLEIVPPESVESGIRSALGAFRAGLHDLCKGSLANIFRAVNDAQTATAQNSQAAEKCPDPNNLQAASQNTALEMTSGSNNSDNQPKSTSLHHPAASSANSERKLTSPCTENPAPKSREEMLKFHFEPTMDRNSAYRHIRLSDGDRKATLRAENQNYPEHIERFVFWRQVICQEPLAGSPYYWEVEWTGQKVTIGVTYKDIKRSTADDSSRLGHNEFSWSLYWSGTAFSLWHAGKETLLAAPKARRIGVYLDQQAGVLAFYRVSHNQAHQICSVETEFSRALYPGFRFWSGAGSTITVCQLG